MKKIATLVYILFCLSLSIRGKDGLAGKKSSTVNTPSYTGCSPSVAFSDLDIGNVRARILINGDMWWDLVGTSMYEVPAGSGKKSLYAGALWIGGMDGSGYLKMAAQTYRQSGSDFWPGPVDSASTNINPATCLQFDRFWKITRQEVASFIAGNPASQVIRDWPGNGNSGQYNSLAPFFDRNGDGIYDWQNGDYPKYEFGLQSHNLNNRLNGDQTIWWVFNDVGNIHNESLSINSIGLEIRAQAYAFCTSDTDLSNTTFYTYEIYNRSSIILYNTYLGQFTDPDLGNSLDDYIGCDVSRNFGYCYNGDSVDDGPTGYGNILASVGIDVLSGPFDDSGITELLMNKFIYYDNGFSVTGNPVTTTDYYNYLTGKWKDSSPMVYGGNGYNSAGPPCDFMFPGNSDPMHIGTHGIDPGFGWSEGQPTIGGAPNVPGDRRFLMSSGQFTMFPGGVYYITKAAVWARKAGGIDSSVAALMNADDRIQSFFDSDFNSIQTCVINIGIQDVKNINHSVFPSPASGYFIIRFPETSRKLTARIYSTDGKLVYIANDKSGNEVKINSTGWSSGVYFYNAVDGNNNSASGKISVFN